MKRLLVLLAVAVVTASSVGCNCCGQRPLVAAAPPATCNTCNDPCAGHAPGAYGGDIYGAPVIGPGPIN